MKRLTLEKLLDRMPDGNLLDIHEELRTGIVPATGFAHNFCRSVNRMINDGRMCINPTTYRKVYLPTLSKALNLEFATRYNWYLKNAAPFGSKRAVLVAKGDVSESVDVMIETIVEACAKER